MKDFFGGWRIVLREKRAFLKVRHIIFDEKSLLFSKLFD